MQKNSKRYQESQEAIRLVYLEYIHFGDANEG